MHASLCLDLDWVNELPQWVNQSQPCLKENASPASEGLHGGGSSQLEDSRLSEVELCLVWPSLLFSFCLERNGEMGGSQLERYPGCSTAFLSQHKAWMTKCLCTQLPMKFCILSYTSVACGQWLCSKLFCTCRRIPSESPQCFIYPSHNTILN